MGNMDKQNSMKLSWKHPVLSPGNQRLSVQLSEVPGSKNGEKTEICIDAWMWSSTGEISTNKTHDDTGRNF